MVFIHFKPSQKNNFQLQFPNETKVLQILKQIIKFNNIRIYLDRLIWSVDQLANKGVLKPPELQSVSHEDYEKTPQQYASLPKDKLLYAKKPKVQAPFRYVPDKNNQRYGIILPVQEQQKLLNAVKIGRTAMQAKNETANLQDLLDAVENIRLAVMLTYPAYLDLPEWEPALLLLEQKLPLEILQSQTFELYDIKSVLWWAGKQLDNSKRISEYSGTNPKTKIIVKAQVIGGQQPLREPPVDPKTYQQMVKYYYKKVDESKQFDNRNIETHYEKVESKTLKQKVHLGEDIRFKPF